MSCDRYTDAIVDHACGADLAAEATAHLRGCLACRRMFEEQRQVLQRLDDDLQEALAIEPSAWFEAQTMAGLERSPIRRKGAFWWVAFAAAAAVVILGTLVAIRSGDHQPLDRLEVTRRPVAPPANAAEHVPSSGAQALANVSAAASSGVPRRRERATVAARQQGGPTKPDVAIVTPQAQAIARYLSLVRKGAIDTSSLADPNAIAVAAPDDLLIAPISVEALPVTNVERGIGPGVDQNGIK
jgi:hypothetical protein